MLPSETPPAPPSTPGPAANSFHFSSATSAWTPSAPPATPNPPLSRPLRLATFNCLKDDTHNKDLLRHDLRFAFIFEELKALDADVVGLNEVTRNFLEQSMAEAWIRERYYLSAVLGSPACEHLSSVRGGGAFGNLIMSKLPPDSVEYIDNGSGRHSHAARFSLGARKVTVCSTHLIAAPYVNEGRRRRELEVRACEERKTRRGAKQQSTAYTPARSEATNCQGVCAHLIVRLTTVFSLCSLLSLPCRFLVAAPDRLAWHA